MSKILQLFNVKNWIETFLFKTLVNKVVKHAVTAVIGLIVGVKVSALLTHYGVTVDVQHLQMELTVAFTGLAGWIVTWAQHVLDKDGDGHIG